MQTTPLFAYGTLRDADVLARVLGAAVAPERLCPASAPDCEIVYFPGRIYPALRRVIGVTAPGTMIAGLSATDLSLLDAFEGDEYRRTQIAVSSGGVPLQASVYWPTVTIGAATKWRFEDWVATHKPAFLAAEAADIALWRAKLTAMRDS